MTKYSFLRCFDHAVPTDLVSISDRANRKYEIEGVKVYQILHLILEKT